METTPIYGVMVLKNNSSIFFRRRDANGLIMTLMKRNELDRHRSCKWYGLAFGGPQFTDKSKQTSLYKTWTLNAGEELRRLYFIK